MRVRDRDVAIELVVDEGAAVESLHARGKGLLVVRSAYRQPFGTFTRALLGFGTLDGGLGVMERHSGTGDGRSEIG